MAMSAVLFWVSVAISVIGCNCDVNENANGELAILHCPNTLNFVGSDKMKETTLKDVFSAALGLSVEENSGWNGLSIKDPFGFPEAILLVRIDGVTSLGEDGHLNGPKYPVVMKDYAADSYEVMKHRIQQRFGGGKNKLVRINLSNLDELSSQTDVFGDIMVPQLEEGSLESLKLTVEEDLRFLMELNILKAVADKVNNGGLSAPDGEVDYFELYFRSLHAVADYHGQRSPQVKEAEKLLGDALERLTKAMDKRYDGSVLVAALTADVVHMHRARRNTVQDDNRSGTAKNAYPEDYAAIFNILLWFGVVFVFTLIAIVYALMDMDPGRDSIIYRMTSTRMKKDN